MQDGNKCCIICWGKRWPLQSVVASMTRGSRMRVVGIVSIGQIFFFNFLEMLLLLPLLLFLNV